MVTLETEIKTINQKKWEKKEKLKSFNFSKLHINE